MLTVDDAVALSLWHRGPRLRILDRLRSEDSDGTLDKEEAKAMPRVAKHFDAIDTDKDGTAGRGGDAGAAAVGAGAVDADVDLDGVVYRASAGVPGATTFSPGKCAKIASGVCEWVAPSCRPPPPTVRITNGTLIWPLNI